MKSLLLVTILFIFSSGYAGTKTTAAPADKKTSAEEQMSPGSQTKILESLDQAPDFSLKGSDGKLYSLKKEKGKIIVLEWFNNDCPFVEKHYGTGNMQKLQDKYTKEGVVWFTISSTRPQNALTPDEAKKIIATRGAKQTALLLDSDGTVARAYGAKTTPHMFIINSEGKVVYNGAIDDNPSFRKDTVENARNYVSESLDILLGKSGKKTIEASVTKPYGCSVKI